MPVDTSIYGSLLQPPKSLIGYSADLDAADSARTQLAAQRVNLIGAQQDFSDKQAVRALYQRPGFDPMTPEGMSALSAASPTTALATRKALLDNQKTQADITHTGAQTAQAGATTAATQFETAQKKIQTAMQIVTTANDPATAHAGFRQAVQQGLMTPEEAAQKEQEVPNDPAGFQKWRESSALALLTAKDRFDLQAKQQVQAETARHNQVDESNTRRGQDITRQNNAATIAKDYKVAGLDANGNFTAFGGDGATPASPAGGVPGAVAPPTQPGGPAKPATAPQSPLQGLIQSIGSYKAPENVALARVPPAMRSQVLAEVQRQFPDYDPSTYMARQKAARDFSTGTQGNALRSFAVAGQHLDQLGTLVDALDNGNVQLVNKIGNALAAQTGATAPTNFDAAKDVVSKEVTKAIVAGGGGVAERAELANLMSNAKSPAQLKGVITQYRGLMSAQHDALLQQRRAAGISDSTLPAYSAGEPMAPGAFVITHKDGKPL